MSKMVDSDGTVLVRVKSASHPSCEDVEFACDPKLTSVRQVKEKIRTLYTFHPDIADQRLIYAGHLLDDLQMLTDVFGLNGTSSTFPSPNSYQHSGPYTIHLACTSKSYVSSSQRSASDIHQSDSSSQSSHYSGQMPNPMMQDPRLNGNMAGQSGAFDMNNANGIPPEFFALHRLYVEQMSAYMRHWNMTYGVQDPNIFSGSGAPIFNAPNYPNVNIPGNNPPPQPAPNLAQPNERPRPAGGMGANFGGLGGMIGGPGGAANDDEENQRDLLDWAYTLSRLVLILSVVYFYSNFTRFLLVLIFTIAIAIFQRRPFQNQEAQNGANERQGNNNNNNNPVNPAGVPNRNDAPPNGNEQQQGVGNQANDNAAPSSQDGNAEEQAAENNLGAAAGAGQHRFAYYRDITWTFLTTFFTSLIPEMPQHN